MNEKAGTIGAAGVAAMMAGAYALGHATGKGDRERAYRLGAAGVGLGTALCAVSWVLSRIDRHHHTVMAGLAELGGQIDERADDVMRDHMKGAAT
jgi:hypothetical protein